MATKTKHSAEARSMGALILQHLVSNPGRKNIYAIASAMGMQADADFAVFKAGVEAIPSRKIIRVRGQNGFLMAA